MKRIDRCSICGNYFTVLHPQWADTHECDICCEIATKEMEEFWAGFLPIDNLGE